MNRLCIYKIGLQDLNLNIKIYTNERFPKSKYRKFIKLQYNRDTNDFSTIVFKKDIVIEDD